MNFKQVLMKVKGAHSKGIAEFSAFATQLLIVGVVLALTLTVLDKFGDQITDPNATAALGQVVAGISTLAGFIGVIVVVIVAAVILNYVGLFQGFGGGAGGRAR